MKLRLVALAVVVTCSGCATAQLYDGPRRSNDEVAHIAGDLRINAGSPLTVVLRQVDEVELNLGQNAVDILPGKHRLLVDCRIAETQNVSRHAVDVEVSAGRHYKLVAEAGPGLRECTQVTLQTVDF
ncbi:MAG TPA: hypothetical protein VGQ22_23580 [Steroidobacteraceae bacterium]|jgi:hypothetical protein|nr:hypothetical protein [Steroidobacteraceae bacterium]